MHEAKWTPRSVLAWSALLLLTVWVSATAIRIEVLNHKMGGFLPRPQPPSVEGNDIKWRTSSRRIMEPAYRRHILFERGMTVGQLDDEAVMSIELTADEQSELGRQLQHLEYNSQLRALVSTAGLMQYPLIPAGLVLCLALCSSKDRRRLVASVVCAVFLLAAGALLLYREYFPSLGW